MRKYFISLIAVTLALVLISFVVLWTSPEHFINAMPVLALYFCVITGLQHYLTIKSMYKSPRTFVKVFLSTTVAVLFIHLVVLAFWLFTHPQQSRLFALAFSIGYAVFLVFETVSLVCLIQREKKKNLQQ